MRFRKVLLIALSVLLQSTVQLGLDFLSPESLGEAVRMAEEIRGLPNTHDAKLQMLEVCVVILILFLPQLHWIGILNFMHSFNTGGKDITLCSKLSHQRSSEVGSGS